MAVKLGEVTAWAEPSRWDPPAPVRQTVHLPGTRVSITPIKDAHLLAEKIRLTESTHTFLTECLQYPLEGPQADLCTFVDGPSLKKLILMPRLTWKTSIVTTGYAIKRIVENPNIRIFITSELLKNSKKMLSAIEHYFEVHRPLKDVFGDWVPTKEEAKWNDTEMVVKNRKTMAKESTVTIGGVDVETTSLHFDLIICDDVMGKGNTQTKEQIEKVKEYVQTLWPLLAPGGLMIFVGTVWHFADIYQDLLKDDRYDKFIKGATSDGTLSGVPLFPTLLPIEFLQDQRKNMSASFFANQYMNQVQSDDSAKFKQDWLQVYQEVPRGCYITTTIDPAISKEETADESAIVTTATDHQRNWYVVDARHGRWNPYELVEQLFQVVETFHPHVVGLEKHGFQRTLEYFIRDEQLRRNHVFSITELSVDSRTSKESRIEGLIPLFEAKRVFLKSLDDELAWQLMRYPKYTHDDVLDALSHQLQLSITGSLQPAVQEVNPNSLVAFHEQQARKSVWEKSWSFRMNNLAPGVHAIW